MEDQNQGPSFQDFVLFYFPLPGGLDYLEHFWSIFDIKCQCLKLKRPNSLLGNNLWKRFRIITWGTFHFYLFLEVWTYLESQYPLLFWKNSLLLVKMVVILWSCDQIQNDCNLIITEYINSLENRLSKYQIIEWRLLHIIKDTWLFLIADH